MDKLLTMEDFNSLEDFKWFVAKQVGELTDFSAKDFHKQFEFCQDTMVEYDRDTFFLYDIEYHHGNNVATAVRINNESIYITE